MLERIWRVWAARESSEGLGSEERDLLFTGSKGVGV